MEFKPGSILDYGTPYEVEGCFDGACQTAVLQQDSAASAWGSSGDLVLDAQEDTVTLALGDGDFTGEHQIHFTIRDESAATIASFDGRMELERSQPNGWLCPPTCWSATVPSG